MQISEAFLDSYQRFWANLFSTFKFCLVAGLIVTLFIMLVTLIFERNVAMLWHPFMFIYLGVTVIYLFVPAHIGFFILRKIPPLSVRSFALVATFVGIGVGMATLAIFGFQKSWFAGDPVTLLFPVAPFVVVLAYFVRQALFRRAARMTYPDNLKRK
jgi:hypothetical protein